MELIRTLDECIALADRLTALLEQDRAGIRACIHGKLLEEYLEGTEKAAEMARSMKTTLALLEREETQALLLL